MMLRMLFLKISKCEERSALMVQIFLNVRYAKWRRHFFNEDIAHGFSVIEGNHLFGKRMVINWCEPDFIQVKNLQGVGGRQQMTQMRGIECAAKKPYFHMGYIGEIVIKRQ